MIQYKHGVNILDQLKDVGYSSYRIRKEKLFGERVIQKFRQGELPSWGELDTICRLLKCQPWDLIEYAEDTPAEE